MSNRDSTSWAKTPGFLRAQNIATDHALYEIENRAADPDGAIDAAIQRVAPWSGTVVLDMGAGTGFHLPRFHEAAAHVIALEPDPSLRPHLMQRIAHLGLDRVSVIGASAEDVPLRDGSVDIVLSRFAYFFGAGCEAGLREVERILAPGGAAVFVNNDLRSGTFAEWVAFGYPEQAAETDEDEQFWIEQGFTLTRVESSWRFSARADFERVIRLEFPAESATQILATHTGLEVDYAILLAHRTYD